MKFTFSKDFIVDSDASPYKQEGLRFAFYALPGHGKSYLAAASIIEPFLKEGGTILLFQPKSEWHTLKAKYPIIVVGGPFQDVPLLPDQPAVYADSLVSEGVSMVFDFSELESDEELVNYGYKLLHRVMMLENRIRRPILVVVEEAQEYCPMHMKGREVPPWVYAKMVKQVKDVATQGRKLGLTLLLISQRPAEVNYTARMMCNVSLYGKFHPKDRKDLEECLKGYEISKDEAVSLAKKLVTLETSHWIILTGEGVKEVESHVRRETPHFADTPDLKFQPIVTAQLEKTSSTLAAQIEKLLTTKGAEKTENEKLKDTIRARDERITDLERKSDVAKVLQEGLTKIQSKPESVNPEVLAKLEKLRYYEDTISALKAEKSELERRLSEKSEAETIVEDLRKGLSKLATFSTYRAVSQPVANLEMWRGKLKQGEGKVLDELSQFGKLTRAQLITRTGLASNTLSNDYLPHLKRIGLIVEDKDGVRLAGST